MKLDIGIKDSKYALALNFSMINLPIKNEEVRKYIYLVSLYFCHRPSQCVNFKQIVNQFSPYVDYYQCKASVNVIYSK